MSESSDSESSNGVDAGADFEMDRVGSKVLFENERVRIWEFKLEPGETGNLHRHALDYVLVQIEGDRMAVVPDESSQGEYAEYVEADVVPGQHFWIQTVVGIFVEPALNTAHGFWRAPAPTSRQDLEPGLVV